MLGSQVNTASTAAAINSDQCSADIENAIIDFSGDIEIIIQPAPQLLLPVRQNQPVQDSASLDMLLDPDDLSAMLAHNMELSESLNPSLSPSLHPSNLDVLRIDDVLHREDSLDEYLPEEEDQRWYLEGDGRAIDAGINSAGMQDIYDQLLSQQLLNQYTNE